jgi:hypothetical protein
MQFLRQTSKSTRTISAHPNIHPLSRKNRTVKLSNKWKKVQPEQKVVTLKDDRTKCARGTQRQLKITGDTQRKRTVFEFEGTTLAKNIAVWTDEFRRRTAKKDKRNTKKHRKQDRYMTRARELNVEKLKTTQTKKEKWKGRKQHKQGSTIELLTLNDLQKEKLLGRLCKRGIRKLYRRNKTSKATLR